MFFTATPSGIHCNRQATILRDHKRFKRYKRHIIERHLPQQQEVICHALKTTLSTKKWSQRHINRFCRKISNSVRSLGLLNRGGLGRSVGRSVLSSVYLSLSRSIGPSTSQSTYGTIRSVLPSALWSVCLDITRRSDWPVRSVFSTGLLHQSLRSVLQSVVSVGLFDRSFRSIFFRPVSSIGFSIGRCGRSSRSALPLAHATVEVHQYYAVKFWGFSLAGLYTSPIKLILCKLDPFRAPKSLLY